MKLGKMLIDKSLETMTVYGLAKAINEPIASISGMCKGDRAIPSRVVAELAALHGIDPQAAVLTALIEDEKKPEKQEQLRSIFKVPAAVILSSAALLAPLNSHANQALTDNFVAASVYYV